MVQIQNSMLLVKQYRISVCVGGGGRGVTSKSTVFCHFCHVVMLFLTTSMFVCVTGYRYIAHLYCLAVQAGFYSDVVECSLSTRENLVRSPSGKKEFFFACYIWRPNVTVKAGSKCAIYLYPVTFVCMLT